VPRGAQSRAEAVYRSVQREKLGLSFSYQALPERTKGSEFAFGKPSVKDGTSAKEALCPPDEVVDAEKEAVYKISHGAFAPGEQRTRMLDWDRTGVDPAVARFGRVSSKADKGGIAACLNPSLDPDGDSSRIVPLRVEAHRQFVKDPLGKSRALGMAPYSRPPPERFGMSSKSGASWGAAECLRGNYTEDEQMPDKDLGIATRPGFRNVPKDPERVFGIPSLRTDVPPRTFSVAEPQNFGQDVPLKDLVNPSRFMTRGIDHSDFAKQREKDEIRSVISSIGYMDMDDSTFEAIYHRAATAFDVTGLGSVSLHEFKLALCDYLNAVEETGRPPAWSAES
jgi:hypothetical protein